MKLKTKIKLFSSLFMLILIVLVNTSIYFLFYKMSSDSELDQLSNQTSAITEALQASQSIPPNQLLHAFLPTDGMIRVVSKDGTELIPTITKRREYRELPLEYNEQETRNVIKSKSGVHVAIITKPIIWENGEVVTMQVANHLIPLEETMRTLLYVLIAASLIMLLPLIIAGNVLSRFILRPITELIETMKANMKLEKWQTIDLDNKSQDELYEMEKTFNQMIEHLKTNFEKQEVFVSDASHELKTPISIIKSYAQLLKRRGKSHPEVFDEAVEAIDSETERMKQLVNQMLTLAKNKEHAPFKQVDLQTLILKVIQTFTSAYDRNIHFDAQGAMFSVHGDIDQLKQIIYILLDNAIKYSEDEIKVRLIENESLQMQVIDQGQGISEADQKHLFDRFYRVDKSRRRETGGTGLGLAIAKTIAQLHHGNLTVTSELGKGATFTLELPIIRNDSSDSQQILI